MKRAKAVEAEALRIEARMKRLTVDAPGQWLEMALDARRRQVPEPDPSALAHRALRARLAAASDLAELKATVKAIESFFPDAATDRESARANLASWEAAYANDPMAAYLSAPRRSAKRLIAAFGPTPTSGSWKWRRLQACNRPSPCPSEPRPFSPKSRNSRDS